RCPAWWRRRAPPRAAPRLASPAFPTRRSSDLSRLRNQNNILHSIRENYISHTTTTQYKLFVRENGTHTYRTGSLINNTTYSVNLTFFSIHRTVSQLQFHSRHLLQLFFQCATGSC